MSETHTPGPWQALPRQVEGGEWVGGAAVFGDQDGSRRVCTVHVGRAGEDERWRADARLIAAAPAMKEALEELMTGLQHLIERTGASGIVALMNIADAALAQTEGP